MTPSLIGAVKGAWAGLNGTSGAHQWRGVIEEYRERLPVSRSTPVVTLCEGGTPLIYACGLSERL
ncbi:MAG: threonine synthase, partial [Candidatus Nanopelagicaceae bacterium]